MDVDQSFDFDRAYYRVIGTRDGYIYNAGEDAVIASESGLVTHARPYFEFEDLKGVGSWLHLGDRVRRLRVPRGATVVINRPFSQGGCYTWSADRVELLDVLDRTALIQEMAEAGAEPSCLFLHEYEFPAGFRFPARVGTLILRGCLACEPLEFPASVFRLAIWGSLVRGGRFPREIELFEAIDSDFEDLEPPALDPSRVHVDGCTFMRRDARGG